MMAVDGHLPAWRIACERPCSAEGAVVICNKLRRFTGTKPNQQAQTWAQREVIAWTRASLSCVQPSFSASMTSRRKSIGTRRGQRRQVACRPLPLPLPLPLLAKTVSAVLRSAARASVYA